VSALSCEKLAETRAALWELGRSLDMLMARGTSESCASEAQMEAALKGMRYLHDLIADHLAATTGTASTRRTSTTPRRLQKVA
jgi:hypothetical protein